MLSESLHNNTGKISTSSRVFLFIEQLKSRRSLGLKRKGLQVWGKLFYTTTVSYCLRSGKEERQSSLVCLYVISLGRLPHIHLLVGRESFRIDGRTFRSRLWGVGRVLCPVYQYIHLLSIGTCIGYRVFTYVFEITAGSKVNKSLLFKRNGGQYKKQGTWQFKVYFRRDFAKRCPYNIKTKNKEKCHDKNYLRWPLPSIILCNRVFVR